MNIVCFLKKIPKGLPLVLDTKGGFTVELYIGVYIGDPYREEIKVRRPSRNTRQTRRRSSSIRGVGMRGGKSVRCC